MQGALTGIRNVFLIKEKTLIIQKEHFEMHENRADW